MFQEVIHRKIYFYLFAALACALPLSVFANSTLQILLLVNWIIEGKYRIKWQRLTSDRAFLVYAIFFALHIVAMAWSTDLQYGFKDLKAKLPLIVIPFLFVSSGPLTRPEIKKVIFFFIAGTLVGSFASVLAVLGVLPVEVTDFRDASLFVGHIRFSLMVVLSVFFSIYFIFHDQEDTRGWLNQLSSHLKWFFILSAAWLSAFLILLKSLSGIVIYIVVLLFLAFHAVKFIPDRVIRFMVLVFVIFIPLFSIIYLGSAVNRFYTVEDVDMQNLDSVTVNGNPYIHHTDNREIENGHYVWIYFCKKELKREWNRRSDVPYYGETANGELVRFSLIRYLTSKGLRKDSVGVHRLTEEDIQAIEQGIANHIYLEKFALYPRIYEVIWEFDRYRLGSSANDKSLVQRYYYLKAGWHIFKEHPWFGVGTGDVRSSFHTYYRETNSVLTQKHRRRAHNQYLTFAIAFGLPGFFIAMLSLLLPVFMKRRWSSYFAAVFLLSLGISMLNEDTLENNAGVVIFGLFYALFVFGPEWKWARGRKTGDP